MGLNVVNPEAIGVFGLFATVMCFGLEMMGVGVKGAEHSNLSKSLAYIAIYFGGSTQIFTAIFMFLFSVAGANSLFLGTVFAFFGLFWVMVGTFFLKGGDKKVFAHFFASALVLTLTFTYMAFKRGLVWPLGVDLIVIDALLITLVPAWYTGNPKLTKLAGLLNIIIGLISILLLFPAIGANA